MFFVDKWPLSCENLQNLQNLNISRAMKNLPVFNFMKMHRWVDSMGL